MSFFPLEASSKARQSGTPAPSGRRRLPRIGSEASERRGLLRPPVLAAARSRFSDWTAFALFRAGDALALSAVGLFAALAALRHGASPVPALPALIETVVLFWSLHAVHLSRLSSASGLGRRYVRLAAGFGLAFGANAAIAFALRWPLRGALFSGVLAIDLPLVFALHGLWQAQIARWRAAGRLTPNIVVVGATPAARRLVERIARTGEAAVLGIFDDRAERSQGEARRAEAIGAKVLGDAASLARHRILPFVDRIVIALPRKAERRVGALLAALADVPNEIMLLVEADGPRAEGEAAQRIAEGALQRLAGRAHDERRALIKRAQDLVIGAAALVLASPILLVVALVIRLDSPGPVLFRQRRHGFNNEEISVFKFRSMRADAADPCAARQVCADDPRVTRVGRFIRRTSLDELPQLFNVLRGEMSLVGPRPHAVGMKTGDAESGRLVAGYAHRHRLKPGMTGWAAIHGSRGPLASAADIARRVALDVEYIERQSFWLDLRIMAATLPCLIGDRNLVR